MRQGRPSVSARLIPRSKISDDAVRMIVHGFAYGRPRTEISEETGIGSKAVKSVLLALRPRLLLPALSRWVDPGDYFAVFDVPYQEIVERAVYRQFAQCYFNKRCLSNYRQGRRANRQCRACPMAVLLEDRDSIDRGFRFLDRIHAFYDYIGIGGERGDDRGQILRLRWTHTMTVSLAAGSDHLRSDNTSPAHLEAALIESLETEPLKRP